MKSFPFRYNDHAKLHEICKFTNLFRVYFVFPPHPSYRATSVANRYVAADGMGDGRSPLWVTVRFRRVNAYITIQPSIYKKIFC
jgi:hypothetical protein